MACPSTRTRCCPTAGWALRERGWAAHRPAQPHRRAARAARGATHCQQQPAVDPADVRGRAGAGAGGQHGFARCAAGRAAGAAAARVVVWHAGYLGRHAPARCPAREGAPGDCSAGDLLAPTARNLPIGSAPDSTDLRLPSGGGPPASTRGVLRRRRIKHPQKYRPLGYNGVSPPIPTP